MYRLDIFGQIKYVPFVDEASCFGGYPPTLLCTVQIFVVCRFFWWAILMRKKPQLTWDRSVLYIHTSFLCRVHSLHSPFLSHLEAQSSPILHDIIQQHAEQQRATIIHNSYGTTRRRRKLLTPSITTYTYIHLLRERRKN